MVMLDNALKKYGLSMPSPPAKGGIYEPVKEFGTGFCYLSGCVPAFNGEIRYTGKLGSLDKINNPALNGRTLQSSVRYFVAGYIVSVRYGFYAGFNTH